MRIPTAGPRPEYTWTEDAGENITVCFSVTILKGPDDALPSVICSPPSPVTGTPVKMLLFGEEHIFRIGETGLEE